MTAERNTILIPVDFDGTSHRAIETAKWLAAPLDADLILLYAHDRPAFEHPELPSETIDRVRAVVERDAQRSLARLAEEVGAKRSIFRHGDAASVILDVAAELSPTMVVMGTHGRKGINRFLLGSVAAHVVRACTAPVVTVRSDPGERI